MTSVQKKIQKVTDRLFKKSGFTLIEAVVTVVIFSFIAGGVYATMVAGDNSWNRNSLQIELQQELRKSMNGLYDDLRQSGKSAITNVPANGNWYSTITFYKANGVSAGKIAWSSNTTQYLLGGANSTQLQRKVGTVTKVVAQDISSLQVRRLASIPNIVEVSLQAVKNGLKGGGTVSDSLDFKVSLRN